MVQTGLDRFLESPPQWVFLLRWGLLCNPASVNHQLVHARELIHSRFPNQLKALFSPQHGFFAEKQDNMIESSDRMDPVLKIPVFSLYGSTRIPTKKMFDLIDLLIVDLQDVGTRVYTFIYTMSFCMEAAREYGKKILVLDRPNPISGSIIEGGCLATDCASFVGRFPIPMRHGLTIGELARMFNDYFKIHCDLDVVPMKGWHRHMFFKDTGLPWVLPSPNIPTPDTAMVYPGQVIWEGTNVSEGRGTTKPFEFFGAPFFDTEKILKYIGGKNQTGAFLRPIEFEPTSNKWSGTNCKGFQIHVTNPVTFRPYITSLKILQAVLYYHSTEFQWKAPPYEYEYKRMPIDLIIGNQEIRKRIESFEPLDQIESSWIPELQAFYEISRNYWLYDEV